MKIKLAFMLALAAMVEPKDQKVILIGAPVRAKSDQEGKVLTDGTFLSADGETITVTTPEGFTNEQTIAQLQEFIQHVGGRVIQADVRSENFNQATAEFIEEGIFPYSPANYSGELVARKLLGNGEQANTVSFIFDKPFVTAPNLSLAMILRPNTSVCVVLTIELNAVPRPASAAPMPA